jgi:phosphoglycolate phosphatase
LALVAKFRERYADVGYSENSLYPGVPDALDRLFRRGTRLGLCTSKRIDFAERILTMFGLRAHFEFVSGGDVGVAKAVQLSQLLKGGLAGPGSTMVGDRAIDIVAGKTNALRAIGVLWGHGSESELADAGADRLLSDPIQLEVLADAV